MLGPWYLQISTWPAPQLVGIGTILLHHTYAWTINVLVCCQCCIVIFHFHTELCDIAGCYNTAVHRICWRCCGLHDFASSVGTPNIDYDVIDQTINVTLMDSAAGETCFNLSVLDDTVLEEPLECLLLTIQLPEGSSDMLNIAPGNDSTLCCIMDDDSELVVMVHRLQTLPQLDISNIT